MKNKIIYILLVLGFFVSSLFGQTSSISLSSGATITVSTPTSPSTVYVCADDLIDVTSGTQYQVSGGTNDQSDAYCQTPSPVELTEFTVSLSGKNVVLNWNTATELANYGFEVQRNSTSAPLSASWETLGFVEGHGNSNTSNDYSFIDTDPPSGKVEYRLKQIDVDGGLQYYYADAVDIEAPKVFKLVQNYPNPFNPTTVITYSIPNASDVTLKVYNTIGEVVSTLVNQHQEAGKFNVTFNASNLPSGIYFYSIRAEGYSSVKKMMLLK